MTAALVENVLQALVAGLLIGMIYGLMCVGLAMIFGIMRIINFAQGDFMMLGMYGAFYLFGSLGLSAIFGRIYGPYAAAILVAPFLFVIGYYVHKLLLSRVSGTRSGSLEGEGHYAQLILTLGIALVLTNGAMILFGSRTLSVRTPLATTAWELGPMYGNLISVFVNKSRVVSALIAIVVIAALALVIRFTRLGKSLRASADNPTAALYMGINVDQSYRIAFGLGVAITAIAGGLLATNYSFHPYVGLEYVIVMYAGVVLGGMGSIMGAFWGGMTIGLIQQMSTLVLPTQLQNTAIFVVFLLIVFFMPNGFFGRSVERT